MKVFEVTLEETLSQTFDVEAEDLLDAIEKAHIGYRNGTYVIDNGTVQTVQAEAHDPETDEYTEWCEL